MKKVLSIYDIDVERTRTYTYTLLEFKRLIATHGVKVAYKLLNLLMSNPELSGNLPIKDDKFVDVKHFIPRLVSVPLFLGDKSMFSKFAYSVNSHDMDTNIDITWSIFPLTVAGIVMSQTSYNDTMTASIMSKINCSMLDKELIVSLRQVYDLNNDPISRIRALQKTNKLLKGIYNAIGHDEPVIELIAQ